MYTVGKIDLGSWNSSSWTMVTQSWVGLVLLSLIYYYGFRRLFVIPLCAYLLIMAVQGFDRFRLVIPLIYLTLVWLSRKGRKWPPLWMVGAGAVIVLAMFPMKTIGRMVRNGAPVPEIVEETANSMTDVAAGQSDDQMVLDEFASTVTLIEDSHRYYYGMLYYPLLTMPIPRQLWATKPVLNEYQHDISTPSRPMAPSGMVPTLHGESYANLGVLGILVISPLLAYWLGRFYFEAMRKSYFSVYRFSYLLVACNLIQVFRDGLISLVVFTVVNMMPLVAIALLSYLSFRKRYSRVLVSTSLLHGRQRAAAKA
jgi:O-antigen polysaccharide polymerase Wzy-like protein